MKDEDFIDQVAEIIGELTALKFFPTDDYGRLAVMKLICSMATNADQVRWLVRRMLDLFDEWPGPRTMRMVFCKRFKPRDGINVSGFIERYPDGIPDERPLPEVPRLRLPAGSVTADEHLDEEIQKLISAAPSMDKLPALPPAELKKAREFERRLEEVITPPEDRLPPPKLKPLKQSDIVRLAHDEEHQPQPENSFPKITTQGEFEARLEEERKKQEGGDQ